MKVKIKKLDNRAKIPTYGTDFSAGADLYMMDGESVTVEPHATVMVHTGLAVEIPVGYAGLVFARSGLAIKHGLTLSNCVGVIDSDYTGEIQVGLINQGDAPYTIEPNERIAQLVIMPVFTPDFVVTDTLEETERGAGGFGSTGRA